jgi:hypothetical protein
LTVSFFVSPEVQQLVEAACDGVLDGEQQQRLDVLIAADIDAARYYARMFELQSELYFLAGTHRAREEALSKSRPADDQTTFLERLPAQPVIQFFAQPTPLSMTVAASVVCVLISAMAMIAMPIYRQMAGGDAQPSSEPVFVAQLTGAHDAVWAEGQVGAIVGNHLTAGHRLELRAGFAELTFDKGAKVTIEGPATLELADDGVGSLELGKLVVRVPKQAIGFLVVTRLAVVQDLGTEFGITIEPGGGSDLYVFEGLVEVRPTAREPLLLATGESLRIEPNGDIGDALHVAAGSMCRGLAALQKLDYAHWSFDERAGDTAHASGPLPGDGRLRPACRGPTWVEGKFGSALAFDGVEDYVLTSFVGVAGVRPRSVAFWVRVPADAESIHSHSILTWGETAPGARFGVAWNRDNQRGVTGAIRVEYQGGWVAGETDIRDGRWRHVAVVFDPAVVGDLAAKTAIYLDGRRQTPSAAKSTIVNTRTSLPLLLGANPNGKLFRGELDELYVFSGALTAEEVQQLIETNEAPKRSGGHSQDSNR